MVNTDEKTKVIITGVTGRMGKELLKALENQQKFELVGAIARDSSSVIGKNVKEALNFNFEDITIYSSIKEVAKKADVIVDFTVPEVSISYAREAAELSIAFVTGTTGWSNEELEEIESLANKIPVIRSGNMSIGINLLAQIVEEAASALSEKDFDIEIIEMHHKHKVDAPSGTALLLGESAAKGRGVKLDDYKKTSRDGNIGERKEGEIGFSSLRGGKVVGIHSVIFAGLTETLEFKHEAHDRHIFAQGALTAARWLKGRDNGLYSMKNVLKN